MKRNELLEIHTNFVNGNNKDAVKGIDDYGLYEFFKDYKEFLEDFYVGIDDINKIFVDHTIIFSKIHYR